jgi:MSHA biogenesis protein MshP
MRRQWRNGQQGLGAIAAIIVLVLLASLAAAIVSLSSTQSLNLGQDVLSARANQSARAGTEWGLFQAFNGGAWTGGSCDNAPLGGVPVAGTLDLSAITGLQVTVQCWSSSYNEGETEPGAAKIVRIYQIIATACPTAPCPGNGAVPGYVERRREAVIACQVDPLTNRCVP